MVPTVFYYLTSKWSILVLDLTEETRTQLQEVLPPRQNWLCLLCGYYIVLFIKKLQAIYLMLYKRYKTAKIKKYKHEHVLAYTFNLSSVARINV